MTEAGGQENPTWGEALAAGNVAACRDFIAHGADVNAPVTGYGDGSRALHVAACSGSLPLCELLREHGAVIDSLDGRGNTPLHRVAGIDVAPVVHWLLTQGAQVEARNPDRQTPLYLAALWDKVDNCRLLVVAGARHDTLPPNAVREDLTPFQVAVMYDSCEAVRYFVEQCGADLGQIALDGRSLDELAVTLKNDFVNPIMPHTLTDLFSQRTARVVEDALPEGVAGQTGKPRSFSPL